GYPKLTPWERLDRLPALAANCCKPLNIALQGTSPSSARLVLTTIAGKPRYVLHDGEQRLHVLTADDGLPWRPMTPERALSEAHAFAPAAILHHVGEIDEDRWTHSPGLDVHRPLHRIRLEGDSPGLLYL